MIAKRFTPLLGTTVLALALAGCGGGTATHEVTIGPLSIADAVGAYTTGCATHAGTSPEYKLVTATFTDGGKGIGTAVVRYRTYGSDSTCGEASLAFDVSATFDVVPLSTVKNITNATLKHPFIGTANTAEATLRGMTLSKGSFTGSLPMPGVKTLIGYVLDKPNLRFLAGSKEADGLGSYIDPIELKKI